MACMYMDMCACEHVQVLLYIRLVLAQSGISFHVCLVRQIFLCLLLLSLISYCFQRIIMSIETQESRHLSLNEEPSVSTMAWVFALGLDSVGVGLGGPVAAGRFVAEECLERAQVELLGRGDVELANVRVWLSSALDLVLAAGLGVEDAAEEAYLVNWVARLWSLYWVARGRADQSLRVLYAGRVAGLGEALLGAAGETARWRLRTWADLDLEEAAALLMAAHPGGSASFTTRAAVAELLGEYLPGPGQTMGDRPLSDGLEDIQMDRYVGSGRLELQPLTDLGLEDVLARRHRRWPWMVDGHDEAEDRGAEVRHLRALEANDI